MLYLRWAGATLLLFLGAFNAFLCWNLETCTGNAADSLHGGLLTLPFYLLGWWIIPKQSRSAIVWVAAIPGILTLLVSFWTLHLAALWNACKAMTGSPFEPSGDELWFVILWTLVSLTFWVGLAMTLKIAGWNKEEFVEQG